MSTQAAGGLGSAEFAGAVERRRWGRAHRATRIIPKTLNRTDPASADCWPVGGGRSRLNLVREEDEGANAQ